MKLLKVYTLIILCLNSVLATNKRDIIITIKKITSQEFWINNFMAQKILVENEVVMLEDALKVMTDYDYSTELHINVVLKASKALYTAQKCKYSDLIVHTFRIFFESISLCREKMIENLKDNDASLSNTIKTSLNEIIKHFIEIKKYIAKFIYNTYHMMNLIPTLKSTDHTLTKSLLSINLYLDRIKMYIDQHKDDASEFDLLHAEIDVQKVISKMINLVERFRCKHCYIEDYYNGLISLRKRYDTDYNSVYCLIKDTLTNLENYYDDSTLYLSYLNNDTQFSMDLYDQKYLLLEDILTVIIDKTFIISDLIVEWKNATNWLTLSNVLNEVKSSYNLQSIYEFQVLLIEVIKSVFYIKYMKKELVTSDDIKTLLDEFDEFINKMIPNNYPSHLYDPIKKFRNSLYNLQFTNSSSILSIFSVQQLRKVLINTTLVPGENGATDNINTIIESLSMRELLSRIVELDKFKIFIQIFAELSYESNTLSDYDLETVSSSKTIEKNNNMNVSCKHFSLLREKLLLFQILVVGLQQARDDQKKIDDSDVKKAKTFIFESLMDLFQTYNNYDKIRKIIIPITIHFKYNHKTNDNLKILLQVLFLNINIMEHFELNNCDSAKYSIDVYYNIIKNEIRGIELNRSFWNMKTSIIQNIIESNTSYYFMKDERRDISSMAVDQFIPTVDFNSCSSKPDEDVAVSLLLWDGSMECVKSVYSAITRGVIDYQYLVRHQCFTIKWFISKVVENFFKILQMYSISKTLIINNELTEQQRNQTQKYLKEFKEIPFSKSINIYLHNIVHILNVSFDDLTKTNTDRAMSSTIIDRLILSTPLFEKNFNFSLQELSNINKTIEADIDFLKSVVHNINNTKYIYDVQFSTCIFV